MSELFEDQILKLGRKKIHYETKIESNLGLGAPDLLFILDDIDAQIAFLNKGSPNELAGRILVLVERRNQIQRMIFNATGRKAKILREYAADILHEEKSLEQALLNQRNSATFQQIVPEL